MMHAIVATRARGLEIIQDFSPRMGKRYANGRNFDHGPDRHDAVSKLSPFIRRRLVTEQEVVAAALAAHGPHGAEKFIEEVIWRGYFKGWLERRPVIWAEYVKGLDADLAMVEADRRLRRRVESAESGTTGIECFDAWASELIETGYLHNHARMWFASIWIFTLGLPWRIGADFFYRHLLDGDAASNTLGWRWVAGLHTRGKPYAADARNIATFTGQRFQPRDSDFAQDIEGLEADEPNGLPPVQPLRETLMPKAGVPTLLLMTDEDCHLEDFDLQSLDLREIATLASSHLRSPRPVAERVAEFEKGALDDGAMRLARTATRLEARLPDDLARWTAKTGATQIVTPYVTRGPLHDWLTKAKPALALQGITLCEWRRPWDEALWPHATGGFFKVKTQIPALLDMVVAR